MSNTKTPAQREAKALARAEYKAEGKRRMIARKQARHQKRVDTAKHRHRWGYWEDFSSPTGKSQWCEWPEGSICQYPCNGDC